MNFLTRVVQGVSFYPLTGFYVGAVTILMLFSSDVINFQTGLIALTLTGVSMLLYSMRREVRTVHILVNSQRTEMLLRIDQLVTALTDAGVPVPPKRTEGVPYE